MNENTEFYKMQFEMINKDETYLCSNMEYSRKRMEELIKLSLSQPVNALELGSGMGLDAINLNLMGVNVDAIEIVEDLNNFASGLQKKYNSNVNFIENDFFEFAPNKKYDLIYYMDGFGVSSHEKQIQLLSNVNNWMTENGTCVIEVYNPIYWKKVDGMKMKISDSVNREYGYDLDKNAFLDTWTSIDTQYAYTQILHCYLPDEIIKMVEETDLVVDSIHPGGAMDYKTWEYQPKVSLEACLNYQVILRKS